MSSETTTTQTTELPPPGPEELAAIANSNALAEMIISESGYTSSKVEKKVPANPDRVSELKSSIADYDAKIAAIKAGGSVAPPPGAAGGQLQAGAGAPAGGYSLQQLESLKASAQSDLDYEQNENTTSTFKTEMTKTPSASEQLAMNDYIDGDRVDPALQAIIDENGANSPQAIGWMRDNVAEVKEINKADLKQTQEMEGLTGEAKIQALKNINKMLKGDISLNKEQQGQLNKFINTYAKGVKEQFLEWGDEIDSLELAVGEDMDKYYAEVDLGYAAVNQKMDEFNTLITDTGLKRENAIMLVESRVSDTKESVMDALQDVSVQIGKTDEATRKAIDDSLTASMEVAGLQFDEFKKELGKQINQKAIMTGRNPADPTFQAEMQTQGAEKIEMLGAILGKEAMDQHVARVGSTGGKLETLGYMIADVEDKTGIKMEQLGLERLKVISETGGKLEQAKLMEADVEQSKMAMRSQGALTELQTTKEIGGQRLGKASEETSFAERLSNIRANTQMSMAYGIPQSGVGAMQTQEQVSAAVDAQGIQNLIGAQGAAQAPANYYANLRMAQPTTTNTVHEGFSPWDVVGGIAMLGGAAGKIMTGIG